MLQNCCCCCCLSWTCACRTTAASYIYITIILGQGGGIYKVLDYLCYQSALRAHHHQQKLKRADVKKTNHVATHYSSYSIPEDDDDDGCPPAIQTHFPFSTRTVRTGTLDCAAVQSKQRFQATTIIVIMASARCWLSGWYCSRRTNQNFLMSLWGATNRSQIMHHTAKDNMSLDHHGGPL
jgi:hypothetical protein